MNKKSLTPSDECDEKGDFLLAKALASMENENIYKKPLGFSYRKKKNLFNGVCEEQKAFNNSSNEKTSEELLNIDKRSSP